MKAARRFELSPIDIGAAMMTVVGGYLFFSLVAAIDVLPFLGLDSHVWAPMMNAELGPILRFESVLKIESGGLVALGGFLMLLFGVTVLRRGIGLGRSVAQSALLVAPGIIFLWSLDFVFIDKTQLTDTAVYYAAQIHQDWITNELVLGVSVVWLVCGYIVFRLGVGKSRPPLSRPAPS